MPWRSHPSPPGHPHYLTHERAFSSVMGYPIGETMYGIILNDHTDPYITCRTADMFDWLVRCHYRWTNSSDTLTTVVLDPECAWCEDQLDGWFEIDEVMDFVEPPLHDHCRAAYGEQQDAMHYV